VVSAGEPCVVTKDCGHVVGWRVCPREVRSLYATRFTHRRLIPASCAFKKDLSRMRNPRWSCGRCT